MVQISTQTTSFELMKTRYKEYLNNVEEETLNYEDITELYMKLLSTKKSLKKNCNKLPLRKSLFPNVSPYVEFQAYNCNNHDNSKKRKNKLKNVYQTFPKEISDHMTWELGGGASTETTPWIVKKIVENCGYRTINGGGENWCGIWSDCRYAICYNLLKREQKMNHFPGTYEIGHKDKLCKNFARFTSIFGKKQFDFVPRTFILPKELEELKIIWDKNRSNNKINKWIIKPSSSSRGRGISLVSRWTQVPKNKNSNPIIIQEYISNPKLINDSKFDLRIYVLVTDFNPLKIYVHSEGIVRFASSSYNNDENSLSDKFVHLTNYSVNKFSKNYLKNDTIDEPKGHKWSLKCFWDYLTREENVDVVSKLKSKINDIVIKTIISAESSVNCFSRVHLINSKHNCYELLGFDVLIDDRLKPWLLEVNISPSLHTPSILDAGIKGRLIKDVLNVAGYRVPSTLPQNVLRKICDQYDVDFSNSSLDHRRHRFNDKEKRKQIEFTYNVKKNDRGDSIRESITANLTSDDVRCLVQYEDELARLGEFEKVFPTRDTKKYFKYFESPRYYNLLLSAWEIDNSSHRSKGIKKLQDLCKRNYHLR